ncbi:MAG: methyltransferase domain-containing protein [Candidatus Moraniibacteriota bacterium]
MTNLVDTIAGSISKKSRAQKWAQFLAFMTPGPDDRLIDVGVNTIEYSEADNYLERHYIYPQNITAVGMETDFAAFKKRYPEVTTVTSDGTRLPFEDNSFDIGCSNAVIEHVGGHEKQLAFLRELYRVARRGYITTPNRLFPVEVHTRIPLLHIFLSKKGFDRVATAIGKGWAAGEYMHLLSERELRALAEEAGMERFELIRNRFCGFPMTFTLIWNRQD